MPAAACATLLALSLAACTPTSSTPSPTPTPSRTALFSSDAEALKAATDAYAAYLKVTDEVLHDGGRGSDRYERVAEGSALKKALDGAKDFRQRHLHTIGESRFDSAELQVRAAESVSIYVCDDVTRTDLLDANGQSQVRSGAARRTPWQVEVRSAAGQRLLVSKRDYWTGSDYCGH
jgi:hypothetical protein